MRVTTPLRVAVPARGVVFAESIHAAGFRMAERSDPFHKLVYILDGKVRFQSRQEIDWIAESGTVLLIPSHRPHQIIDQTPATLLLLCLGGGFMRSDPALLKLWRQLAGELGTALVLGRSERLPLEAWWRRAMMEHAGERAEAGLGLRLIAAQMLLFLVRRAAKSGPSVAVPARVDAVVREVDETFFEEWSLERAAARAGLSRRRFSELFRVRTQATFLDYLTRKRLDYAGQLFRRGEHSVLGVMFSCGFRDLSHFYRSFRSHYGQPPRQWLAGSG